MEGDNDGSSKSLSYYTAQSGPKNFVPNSSSQSTITSPLSSPYGTPNSSPYGTPNSSPRTSTSLYYPIIPLSRQITELTMDSGVDPPTTMTTMVEQGQHTNCGSITLAELLIDAYKNIGQEILEKDSDIDDNIKILLISLSDFRVRQLLKHYMGTDKMLQLLGYNEEYNTEHPQSKQLDNLPVEITEFINSDKRFNIYLSEDPNFINKCIFICTLFIFFLTSFNTLQHKEDNSIQLWNKNSQDFTFRLDTEALTYYTQPKYDNFENLCFIFRWTNLVTWSDLSIFLLKTYFDTIGKYKDVLNKKRTLQIKANIDGNYDMYTFKLQSDLNISSIKTPITIPGIIILSEHIIKTGQSIQFSTNVSQLDVHFSSVSCHSVVLVGYKNNIFKAKNSWRNEHPSLDIDLKRILEVIRHSLKKTGDIMMHYSELFTIINEDEYSDLIRLLKLKQEELKQEELKQELERQKQKKYIKRLKFILDKKKLQLPEEILEIIYRIREKQLELEKDNDELDVFISEKLKSKKEIKNLEKEYQKKKQNINKLIKDVNKKLTQHDHSPIPLITGGSIKTIKIRKRKTIKRRKKRTNRKFSRRRN